MRRRGISAPPRGRIVGLAARKHRTHSSSPLHEDASSDWHDELADQSEHDTDLSKQEDGKSVLTCFPTLQLLVDLSIFMDKSNPATLLHKFVN